MAKGQDYLKARLGKVSAKTLSLGAKQFVRGRNEQKVSARINHCMESTHPLILVILG